MKLLKLVIISACLFSLSGCQFTLQEFPRYDLELKLPETNRGKDIFVFLDGTATKKATRSNVWRMFEALRSERNPNTRSIYIEGVGASSALLTGTVLGRGMEIRVSKAYRYIAKSYEPGDRIFIYGYSRGAHQARALAGLISYAGIIQPTASEIVAKKDTILRSKANSVIEFVKDQKDDYSLWANWNGENPLRKQIQKKINERYNPDGPDEISMRPAEIHFLGLWDNAPGSMFKSFSSGKSGITLKHPVTGVQAEAPCKEDVDTTQPERYKLDSYPAIKKIVHAVAVEEKRSHFSEVLVCKAMDESKTIVKQQWFPGSHGDVGGGYSDDNTRIDGHFYDSLSTNALNWMAIETAETSVAWQGYTFRNIDINRKVSAKALAHLSITDFPKNFASKCIDRALPVDPEYYSEIHLQRAGLETAPIKISKRKVKKDLAYPVLCGDWK